MSETTEISRNQDFISTLPHRIIATVGATATILLIFLVAYWFELIPSGVSISIGLFISLPLVFTFIFGVILDKPDFTSTLRHYGFGIYILIALIAYFVYMKPDSFMLFGKYIIQFFIGFFLSMFSGACYLIPYHLLRKYKYRIKASISLGISTILSFTLLFILKYYKVFEWVT